MMLTVSNLNSGYGRIPILHDINFQVTQGECVGVWGHNGMGKTTLLGTIAGFQKVTSGAIVFDGEDITRTPTHQRARKGIGLVPQGRQIFPTLTVMENLKMGYTILGSSIERPTEQVLELFPRLKPLLGRIGGLLSGGEQQLLALARCLAGNPKVVMLDEPTEGIQPSINEEISETLAKLRAEHELSLILVEQRREFIASLADRVLVMQSGQLIKETSPAGLLEMDEIH